ncbi:tetrahydromethanopterin S-methyltransferase subunit F, partial [Cryobacterium sp. CG_9.6]|nr:tetrahydromethanopterin S-methyltransferase subunit F [Cryobacterium sp. CG_9.6]
KPYIDDNPMFYLAADNPTFDWVDEYVNDVRTRQLPAYLATQS